VAERKRPGDDAAGDRPEDEAYTDSDLQDDAADEPDSRGGDKAESGSVATKREGRRGGNRISGFFREVVSELRKVIWPTRKELLTYTGVVIVFVTVVTTIVALLDFGFGKAVLATFGN
jgi:preprotein translocase subunit SecE